MIFTFFFFFFRFQMVGWLFEDSGKTAQSVVKIYLSETQMLGCVTVMDTRGKREVKDLRIHLIRIENVFFSGLLTKLG